MTQHSNLNAISCSSVKSRRQGLEIKLTECIVLYCTCKGIIPILEKQFPREIGGFPVDVREGYAIQTSCKEFCQPLLLGVSVGAEGIYSSGSIGPFVEEENSRKHGFLSCAHVFLEITTQGYYRESLWVVQPSDEDSREQIRNRRCGILRNAFLGNIDCKGTEIGTDISYVEITCRDPASPAFPAVSLLQERDNGYIKNPVLGDVIYDLDEDDMEHKVYKCGRTTEFTKGAISTQFCSMKRSTKRGNIPGGRVIFVNLKHLYEIHSIAGLNVFFQLGDSGAAVYIKKRNKLCLIGIAMGQANDRGDVCYVSPIAAAIQALRKDNLDVCFRTFQEEEMEH